MTTCQLGYPTKNSLVGWYREYTHERELRSGYRRSVQKYSDDQKQAAVQHYLEQGRCIAVTLKTLGCPCRETLEGWIEKMHPQARQRLVGRVPSVPRTHEVKNAAVIDLCTRKRSAQSIAQELAVWRV